MTWNRTASLTAEQQQLKQASRSLIRAAGGGDAAGMHVGSRQQRMSDCGSPNTSHFLRVDEIAALEDITHGSVGHPAVTRLLARRQGYLVVKEPTAATCQNDLYQTLSAMAAAHGDLASTAFEAIGDGHVSLKELAAIAARIEREMELSAQMLSIVRALYERGKCKCAA